MPREWAMRLMILCSMLPEGASLPRTPSSQQESLDDFLQRTEGAADSKANDKDAEGLLMSSPEPVLTDEDAPAASHKRHLVTVPLDPEHKARALSHVGNSACFNDCPPGPGTIGSINFDNYCDDGAPSTAYCLDPTGTDHECEESVTNWCPFGHDCADCGPRKVENICECCAVLFHGAPGEKCGKVPLWELKDWACPAGSCQQNLPSEVLCDRVIYNWRSVSSIDTEDLGRRGTPEFRAGRPLEGGGRRVGYYQDPLCELQASPGPYGQHLSSGDPSEIIDFQIGVPPPAGSVRSPPPPPDYTAFTEAECPFSEYRCCALLFTGGQASSCSPAPVWDLQRWVDPTGSKQYHQLCNSVQYGFTQLNPWQNPVIDAPTLHGGGIRVGVAVDPYCFLVNQPPRAPPSPSLPPTPPSPPPPPPLPPPLPSSPLDCVACRWVQVQVKPGAR